MALSLKSALPTVATKRCSVGSRPLPVRAPCRKLVIRASAEPEYTEQPEYGQKVQNWLNDKWDWARTKWEETEDAEKPAVVAILASAIVAQIAIGATIDVVDRIPIINKLLQLVGIIVTGYYTFKIATDPEERDVVKGSVAGFVNKVTGDEDRAINSPPSSLPNSTSSSSSRATNSTITSHPIDTSSSSLSSTSSTTGSSTPGRTLNSSREN